MMAIIGIITGIIALVAGIFAMFMAAEATRIADRVKSINEKYGVTKSDDEGHCCHDHHNH
jgi:hypothetical protein